MIRKLREVNGNSTIKALKDYTSVDYVHDCTVKRFLNANGGYSPISGKRR